MPLHLHVLHQWWLEPSAVAGLVCRGPGWALVASAACPRFTDVTESVWAHPGGEPGAILAPGLALGPVAGGPPGAGPGWTRRDGDGWDARLIGLWLVAAG